MPGAHDLKENTAILSELFDVPACNIDANPMAWLTKCTSKCIMQQSYLVTEVLRSYPHTKDDIDTLNQLADGGPNITFEDISPQTLRAYAQTLKTLLDTHGRLLTRDEAATRLFQAAGVDRIRGVHQGVSAHRKFNALFTYFGITTEAIAKQLGEDSRTFADVFTQQCISAFIYYVRAPKAFAMTDKAFVIVEDTLLRMIRENTKEVGAPPSNERL